MKWLLILWACPVALIAGWYWLSYYDMSFGFFMLTRETHDLVFRIYGNILGIDPQALPPLLARTIAFDSLIVFAIIAFRKRRAIFDFARSLTRRQSSSDADNARAIEPSLSSAP